MASPARKPPAGTDHPDEALDILRRLEPVLSRMDQSLRDQGRDIATLQSDVTDLKGDFKKFDDRQRKQGEDIAELKGRMTGIEGQLRQIPTLWQIVPLIFAIFGAAFVLIRFASGH